MSVRKLDIEPWALRHVAPSLNLIQEECRQGHFTSLYLQPRYVAGLGLQLICLLLGRIRLPDGVWYRARAFALEVDGVYAGFSIVRRAGIASEIYMCALADHYRGRGLGRAMLIRTLAMGAPAGSEVVADCLPDSRAMMAVLQGLGFRRSGSARQGAAIRFHQQNISASQAGSSSTCSTMKPPTR